MIDFIIIFCTSLVATTLSSMSGGGASVINIPVLLWLGVSFPMATAAQKVSSTFWVLPASYNYLKDRRINWTFLIIFSLVGLVGAYFGTMFILNIDQRILQIVIGVLILILVAYTFLSRNMGLAAEKVYSKFRRSTAYVFALILGFYEGIFGAGNGIMFSIVTLKTRGFDFVDALGYYYSVAFPWCIFAAGLLISKGYFDLGIMVPIVCGSLIGGYIGSKYAKYKGNKFIKVVFMIVGTILGVKLILGF